VGNKLGWIIAGGMVLVLVLAVLLIWVLPGSATPPTAATTSAGRLDRIEVPASIWNLVSPPTGQGLAADDYNKAVVEYFDTDRYGELRKLSEEQRLAIAPGKFPYKVCRFVLAGAAKKEMGYFPQYVAPAQTVKPSHRELVDAAGSDRPPIPHLAAFPDIAETALLYGRICQNHKEHREAERIYKAVLIFGWHVAQDRVRLWGFQVGLKIQQMAAERLAGFYTARGEPDRADKASGFLSDLGRTLEATAAKANEALFRLDPSGRLFVGDLRHLAVNDADPMWRIEAIRQLGLYRAAMSKGGKRADRKAIDRLLNDLKNQNDPLLKAAAELALTLTIQDVRSTR